jgi:hypothetical protein
MKKIFYLLLLLVSIQANGQNAYYDSKYVIDWLRNPQSGQAEVEAQRNVLRILNQYVDVHSDNIYANGSIYPIVDSIYSVIVKRNGHGISIEKHKSTFYAYLQSLKGKPIPKAIDDIKKKIEHYEEVSRQIAFSKNATTQLKTLMSDHRAEKLVINIDKSITISTVENSFVMEIALQGKDGSNLKLWGNQFVKDSILQALQIDENDTVRMAILSIVKKKLEKGQQLLEEEKEEANTDAVNMYSALDRTIRQQMNLIELGKGMKTQDVVKQITKTGSEIAEQQQAIKIRIQSQESQPTVQLSNFKMPSQSEMIDALAIYVAKRFKQEAIMYMIDRLKENMLADTLFSIMFPETRKLLFSQDAFNVPHFGSEWKYAISKDYTLMPDHLLASDYIGSKLNTTSFNAMHDAWLMAKMIEKKYSYVEIIRNFGTNDSAKLKTSVMRTFARWSHMVNEEFFSTEAAEILGSSMDDATREKLAKIPTATYWLSPAEFNKSGRPEQISLLLVMLKHRYSADIEGELSIDLTMSIDSQRKKLEIIKNWISRSLLVLNQFQKNQEQLFNQEVKDDEKSLFNGVSYWTFINDVISSFLDSNIIIKYGYKDISQLQYVADLNEVYSSFQSKNYPAAIGKLMGVVENLCTDSMGYMLSQDLKVKYDKAHFIESAKSAKGKWDEEMRDKLLVYKNTFNTKTNNEDHIAIRNSFTEKLKGIVKELGGKIDSPSLAGLQASINKYDWELKDSYDDVMSHIKQMRDKAGKDSSLFKELYYSVDSSLYVLTDKFDERLSRYQTCYCRSLGKAKTYASLLTDIMNAGGNSQSISKVIEAHAAPPTSYKRKRYTRFTIDLGAYLGAYGGVEWLNRGNKFVNPEFTYGLSVPIGLNFTWAPLKKLKPAKVKYPFVKHNHEVKEIIGVSHTFSISLIDIAAPVAYRLSGDTESALPVKIKWSQLIAPGVHWRLGLKNSPICIASGVQFTPQLRSLSNGNVESALRLYAGVLFDMPLLFIKK